MPSIKEFKEAYEQADSYAREVWHFRQSVVIPAHNQLRYAGHHFSKAIGPDGSLKDVKELERAIAHCERAMYEAAEAGIMSAVEYTSIFGKAFTKSPDLAKRILPDFPDIMTAKREAQGILARPRSDELSSADEVERHMEVFRNLREGVFKLEDNGPALNAAMKKSRSQDRRSLWTIGFAGAAALAAFLLALFAWMDLGACC